MALTLHPNGSVCQGHYPSAPWWPELPSTARLVTCSGCGHLGAQAESLEEIAELLRRLGHQAEVHQDKIVVTLTK